MSRYRSNPFIQAFLSIGLAAMAGCSIGAIRAEPEVTGDKNPVLDQCPVTRAQYDRLRLGVPEYAIMDAIPCGKGEIISESDIGFGRKMVLVKVWRFPKEGGGSIVIITTGGDVTNKRWE